MRERTWGLKVPFSEARPAGNTAVSDGIRVRAHPERSEEVEREI